MVLSLAISLSRDMNEHQLWQWTVDYLKLVSSSTRFLELQPPCDELPSLVHLAPVNEGLSDESREKLSRAGYKTAAVKRGQVKPKASEPMIMKHGDQIKTLRRENLTTRQIGRKLGISHSAVAIILRHLNIK